MKLSCHTITWGGVVGHPVGVTSVKDLFYRANAPSEPALRDVVTRSVNRRAAQPSWQETLTGARARQFDERIERVSARRFNVSRQRTK